MQIQDNEFWQIAEEKLIEGRMLKYLNVHECCELIDALGFCERGSDELIDMIDAYIVKHQLALT